MAKIPTPRAADDDEVTIGTIWARYHGKLNDVDLSIGTAARAQLALDLGMLIGMCLRLKKASTEPRPVADQIDPSRN